MQVLLWPLVYFLQYVLPSPLPAFSVKRFLRFLGPGWLVAMAYLDPGNLEADMQAGAARGSFSAAGSPYAGEEPAQSGYGYSMLWLLLWGHAFGGVFQVLAARLGNVTNADLATLCRKEYGAIACFFLWLATEAAIIGADFQAVIGSALALQVLLGLPMWLGVCLTLVDCLSVLAFKGSGSRGLERVFGCLILVMATCFGVNVCLSRPSLLLLLRGLALPSVPASRQEAASLLSMLGCILMPHGLYLHSALVKSRKVDRHNPEKVMEANYYFGLEAALALTVSFILNACVVCTFASPRIPTPHQLELATAADALREAFGVGAFIAWALGLLAAGQNATMAGTYAGQFAMQGFLRLRCSRTVRLMATRLITIGPLLLLLLLRHETLDRISEAINILQALLLPLTLVPLLVFSISQEVMGDFALTGWRSVTAMGMAAALAVPAPEAAARVCAVRIHRNPSVSGAAAGEELQFSLFPSKRGPQPPKNLIGLSFTMGLQAGSKCSARLTSVVVTQSQIPLNHAVVHNGRSIN
ncbi:metal transporter Nramp2 [Cyclospora cayetanensis]|uniref:Metal transporter Nramp2 n=1 Tax=Cyclospora cayetanensis TaxID=88456 RepID=A0A6P6RSE4_9EIME|nr:metal transporter Nramp2 [Cyclospora cayetanensis]